MRSQTRTRILVPVELSELSVAAVDWAIHFAERSSAEIVLLYICSRERSHLAMPFESLPTGNPLDHPLWHSPESDDLQIRSRIVFDEDVAQTIIRVANSERFDLVVLGVNETGGLRYSGSLAQKVARGSLCPVVTVRGVMDLDIVRPRRGEVARA